MTSPVNDSTLAVTHINPDTLHKNTAFTQVITVTGPYKTVYVGGQNAVDTSGQIVGVGDIKAQMEQTMKNLFAALEAGGARMEDVVRLVVYMVQGYLSEETFGIYMRMVGSLPKPPTVSVIQVAGLANLNFLLEIEAVAVVPL